MCILASCLKFELIRSFSSCFNFILTYLPFTRLINICKEYIYIYYTCNNSEIEKEVYTDTDISAENFFLCLSNVFQGGVFITLANSSEFGLWDAFWITSFGGRPRCPFMMPESLLCDYMTVVRRKGKNDFTRVWFFLTLLARCTTLCFFSEDGTVC